MLVEYRVSDRIARVTLNRPEKRNALSPELIRALTEALEGAASDASVHVIVLRGAGKDFCAGLDLAGLREPEGDSTMRHLEDARRIAELFLALRRNPKPVIAAVQGRALGGGCGLATACDLVICSESASFRYSEIDLGFVAAIVMAILRRSVGEKQAFELLTLGQALGAAEAHRIGMVNRVYPDDGFASGIEEYAAQVASKSASALSLSKRLLYHMDGMSFETAIQSGIFVNALARGTEDARRGIQEFVDKIK